MNIEDQLFPEIPPKADRYLLEEAARRDRTTARRLALVEILWGERCLTREHLIARVEARLGGGCFGEAAWEDTFNRDMQVVKEAFSGAGANLAYSRKKILAGYYLKNEGCLHPDLRQSIKECLHSIDLRQLKIYRDLGFPQRFRLGIASSEKARWAARHVPGNRRMGLEDITIASFIEQIIHILDDSGVGYVAGYPLSVWVWGEPRPAQEIDLFIDLKPDQIQKFSTPLQRIGLQIPQEFSGEGSSGISSVVKAVHASSAIATKFRFLDPEDELVQMAFGRRCAVDCGRELGEVFILSPEDQILFDLLDYSLIRQAHFIRRASAIMLHRGEKLDRMIIGIWSEKKGLHRLWEEIERQATRLK